jgi:acetyl esterase/lipase
LYFLNAWAINDINEKLLIICFSHIDDAVSFAKKAEDAGVDITLRVGEGLFHCYPVCAPFFPEAISAMDEISSLIKKHLRN